MSNEDIRKELLSTQQIVLANPELMKMLGTKHMSNATALARDVFKLSLELIEKNDKYIESL